MDVKGHVDVRLDIDLEVDDDSLSVEGVLSNLDDGGTSLEELFGESVSSNDGEGGGVE